MQKKNITTMSEKFKCTRGSGKPLLQTAILLHETKEFNKLSIKEIYSILLYGYITQEDLSRTHNNEYGWKILP